MKNVSLQKREGECVCRFNIFKNAIIVAAEDPLGRGRPPRGKMEGYGRGGVEAFLLCDKSTQLIKYIL